MSNTNCKMSNTNRVFWIDLVKGIAIILVVVGHILQMRLQPLLTGLYEFIYNFHMPLFLFMSGYVLKSIIFKANMNYLLDRIDGFWQTDGRVGDDKIARKVDKDLIKLLKNINYISLSTFNGDFVIRDITERKKK